MPEELTYYCDDDRHLICTPYSVWNLHMMAKMLGLKRCWFHKGKLGRAHYDMPISRTAEITAKCTKISTRELLQIIIDGDESGSRKEGR